METEPLRSRLENNEAAVRPLRLGSLYLFTTGRAAFYSRFGIGSFMSSMLGARLLPTLTETPTQTFKTQLTHDVSGERATGIEPAWPAWKAGTLPLSYARMRK